MLTNPHRFPPHIPPSENTNRIKNFARFFNYILARDNKYVVGHACIVESIKLALGTNAKANNTRIDFGLLPFDKDPSSAKNFFMDFENHLGCHCKLHHDNGYFRSAFSRTLGYDTWSEMMFVLGCYNNLTHNSWVCCNRKIRRPRVIDGDQENPRRVILGGSSSSNYGRIIPGDHYEIYKRDDVWMLYSHQYGLFPSMRRYWGATPWDAIAWNTAVTLWSIGTKAWNTYISLSASDKARDVILSGLGQAESEAIEWKVTRGKIQAL